MAQRRRKGHRPVPDDEASGSHRLCALTHTLRTPDELIRFTATPDGEIVPDLSRQLPGRGVWLTCEKGVVDSATRANVFARGLKRQVKVPSTLADTVETLLAKRAREAFALANKAGLVRIGFSQVQSVIVTGDAAALVHAREAALDGRQKLDRKYSAVAAELGRAAKIVTSLSTDDLSLAMGRSNVIHAALTQGGATERFLNEAERLERYRSGSTASGSAPRTGNSEV